MSDKQKIRNWFKKHKYLTCADAIHRLGVYNLRSRASEMPELISEMIEVIRNDGVKTRVARYRMISL